MVIFVERAEEQAATYVRDFSWTRQTVSIKGKRPFLTWLSLGRFNEKPELSTYWIVVCVRLPEALPVQDAESSGIPASVTGYYQKFGVTQASPEEACRLVVGQISPPGFLDWGDSVVSTVDVKRLDSQILARSGDWTRPGIWYKSGRIFFTP